MSLKKLKIFMRINWGTILIVFIGVILFFSFVYAIMVGVNAFMETESYYKKMTLAGMSFQLYLGLIHAVIFALVSSAFHYWLYMGGGVNKFEDKKVSPTSVNVKWSDIIGMDSVKRDVREVASLIKDRATVSNMGGKIVKGVLMMGPPGVGKTYIAKSIATETGLPFLSAVGSEFVGMFVGLGSSKIKSLFKRARGLSELHGGCIIFIDEIDVIAQPRGAGSSGAKIDQNATINQLLTEMDGLGSGQENIVVLAATNFSDGELDPALMRAGRFDRKIHIHLPGLEDRKLLLSFYMGKMKYDQESVNTEKLARMLVGKSPSDIANLCREASMIATRSRKKKADMDDFREALERISIGDRMEIVLSDKDKLISAYHEAGKVIITYLLVPTQDVFKASIIPRKSGKGVTWLMEKEERYLFDKEDMLGQIKILLGGFIAEKIQFGITSTAVEKDLKEAGRMAASMVEMLGMGSSGVLGISSGVTSEKDKELILSQCLNEVNEVLRKEKELLDVIAKKLLEDEDIDYDSLEEIFSDFGKSRATNLNEKVEKVQKKISWDDIIGMEDAKQEAKEVVQLMKDRQALKKKAGNFVKGIVMLGPPGCGKTYLASVMAAESGIPLISRSGSDFVEMYVGVGASRVRHLFQEAREMALSKGGCLIFIDEIDAVAAKRSESPSGGDSERNSTINQLLVELDGVKEKDNDYNIVVIGATNMSEDYLDSALMRPGRFDRKIYVDLPNYDARKKLFNFYLEKQEAVSEGVDPEAFASITSGWSPAEISNLIREAVLLAARKNKNEIGISEIEEARERIELGLKRKIEISDEEKRKTAYHEAGHCVMTHVTNPDNPPFKLSIVPRRKSLGVSWSSQKGDNPSYDKNDLLGRIKVALGGFAAEKIWYKVTSAGVESDFATSMRIAHSMVWRWGMSEAGLIGNFMSIAERNPNMISDETKKQLDNEAQSILKNCLLDVEKTLVEKKDLVEDLVEQLMLKEELNYNELADIFNKYTD